ncbi:MAG: hypothetical protein E7628_04210 [Ruminococcaceae bacterium]|nr:hypothetical protein [Oscillospiraceae bacterium]
MSPVISLWCLAHSVDKVEQKNKSKYTRERYQKITEQKLPRGKNIGQYRVDIACRLWYNCSVYNYM